MPQKSKPRRKWPKPFARIRGQYSYRLQTWSKHESKGNTLDLDITEREATVIFGERTTLSVANSSRSAVSNLLFYRTSKQSNILPVVSSVSFVTEECSGGRKVRIHEFFSRPSLLGLPLASVACLCLSVAPRSNGLMDETFCNLKSRFPKTEPRLTSKRGWIKAQKQEPKVNGLPVDTSR